MNAALSTRRVSDWVWRDGRPDDPAAPIRLEETGRLSGQFALHRRDEAGGHLLVRDRLGVNKLFFAVDADGAVDSSNYLFELLQRGHRFDDIWSVPSGHAVQMTPASGEYRLHRHAALTYADDAAAPDTDELLLGIRTALADSFERLAAVLRGRRLFVTLSGGLDSTVVAILAREHLGDVTALTFALQGHDGRTGSAQSEDLRAARLVARELGLPLEVVSASPDDVVELLDLVLLYGQDWRDFNVHCGLVNAALGRGLRERLGDDGTQPAPVLLTGDTLNELLADYTPVVYRGTEYYGLPRVGGAALRRFLVAGLDSGDREVGLFNAFGLDTLQPYALAAQAYAAVPGHRLEAPLAKQALVQGVMGARVPAAIYARPKLRAQAGDAQAQGGTLAVIADRGLDAAALRRRLAALLGLHDAQLARWIRGGLYRFAAQPPWAGQRP